MKNCERTLSFNPFLKPLCIHCITGKEEKRKLEAKVTEDLSFLDFPFQRKK
jgi:hypothetical protein